MIQILCDSGATLLIETPTKDLYFKKCTLRVIWPIVSLFDSLFPFNSEVEQILFAPLSNKCKALK